MSDDKDLDMENFEDEFENEDFDDIQVSDEESSTTQRPILSFKKIISVVVGCAVLALVVLILTKNSSEDEADFVALEAEVNAPTSHAIPKIADKIEPTPAKPEKNSNIENSTSHVDKKVNDSNQQPQAIESEKIAKNSPQVTSQIEHNDTNQFVTDDAQEKLQEEILNLKQNLNQKDDKVNKIEDSLDEIAAILNELNNRVSNVQNHVMKIGSESNNLSQEINKIKKSLDAEGIELDTNANLVPEEELEDKPLTYATPEYVVHAVIPGRAWLKSQAGSIISVSEKDTLGDYGKVSFIDAVNGVVTTSSGISFR